MMSAGACCLGVLVNRPREQMQMCNPASSLNNRIAAKQHVRATVRKYKYDNVAIIRMMSGVYQFSYGTLHQHGTR